MKRTVFLIVTLSFALGIALSSATDAPRPAGKSDKSPETTVQPGVHAKTMASDIKGLIPSELKAGPGLRRPQSAKGAVTGITLSWSTVSGAGIVDGTVPGSRLSASAGQSVVLQGMNSGFALSGGFWYGARGCNCPDQFDLDGNGFWDSLDLAVLIDEVFFSAPVIHDTNCPLSRSDANCDGFTDSIDLSYMIDLIFFGGISPCNPCIL